MSAPDRPTRDTIYYDGACGLCRSTARWLNRLDWLDRLEAVDMTSVPEANLPVPLDAAMRGLPMRTRDGRTLIGYPAVRRALLHTPVGALVAWAMYLPGISWVGVRVYAIIAAHRRRGAACAVDG